VVITHTDNIQVPGWSGAGYIILDQETGVGSYKISGGGNGGWFLGLPVFFQVLFFIALATFLSVYLVPLIIAVLLQFPIYAGSYILSWVGWLSVEKTYLDLREVCGDSLSTAMAAFAVVVENLIGLIISIESPVAGIIASIFGLLRPSGEPKCY
jgi:hypothetical protein